MSEQENLEIVRRNYKAFVEGDLSTFRELLHEEVEVTYFPTYSGIPWAQHSWRGRDEVLQSIKIMTDQLELEVFEPDEFIAGNDSVVVLGHERFRIKATGRVVEANWAQVFTLRDGKRSVDIANTATLPRGTRAIELEPIDLSRGENPFRRFSGPIR
jgi:hypothetical protein